METTRIIGTIKTFFRCVLPSSWLLVYARHHLFVWLVWLSVDCLPIYSPRCPPFAVNDGCPFIFLKIRILDAILCISWLILSYENENVVDIAEYLIQFPFYSLIAELRVLCCGELSSFILYLLM